MILRGTIYDKDTQDPIHLASVTITDPSGHIKVGTTSDIYGKYYLDSPSAAYPNYLTISCVGYKTVSEQLYDDFNIDFNGNIALIKNRKELPTVILPPAHPKPKSNSLLWVGILAAMAIASKEKKKQVSGIDTGQVMNAAVVLVILQVTGILTKVIDSLNPTGSAAAGAEEEDPQTPWNPSYYWDNYVKWHIDLIPRWSFFIENSWNIYDSFRVTYDDWETIKGIFDSLRSKYEVSFQCYVFQKTYGVSLLSFLQNGGGILPWDGLSNAHMNILINYVKNLPAK